VRCRYLAVASKGWYGYGQSRSRRVTWHDTTFCSSRFPYFHDASGSHNKIRTTWCNARKILLHHEARDGSSDRNSVSCQSQRYGVTGPLNCNVWRSCDINDEKWLGPSVLDIPVSGCVFRYLLPTRYVFLMNAYIPDVILFVACKKNSVLMNTFRHTPLLFNRFQINIKIVSYKS
jgi:hypothetical protein